jgi:hypothetical protein
MPGIRAPDGDRSKILGRKSDMPLFVVRRDGLAPGGAMTHNIDRAIEVNESRRLLPHEIFCNARKIRAHCPARAGLPIRTLLSGQPIEQSHQTWMR